MGTSTRLSNTYQFPSIEPGASAVFVHDLVISSKKVAPDKISLDTDGAFDVVSDKTSVTLTNVGQVAAAPKILVEYYNTDDRAFGSSSETNLSIKPFVVGGAKDNEGSSGSPAFVSPAVENTIYARLTGNDTSGKGTLAKPYRTFARAIQDVPLVIAAGVSFVVDITGIGAETLPDNYALPAFSASESWSFDFSDDYTVFGTALKIRATPVRVPGPDSLIAAGVITYDPDTLQRTLTVPGARPAWALDAMKGKYLKSSGNAFSNAVITGSTSGASSTLTLVTAQGTFVDPTFPAEIQDLSASLVAGDVGFQASNVDSVQFVGLDIPAFYAAGGNGGIVFAACALSVIELDGLGGSNFQPMVNTYLRDGLIFVGAPLSMVGCFCENMDDFGDGDGMKFIAPGTLVLFRSSTARGCSTIVCGAPTVGGMEAGGIGTLFIDKSEISGSTGDGVQFQGSIGRARFTKIQNCAGNGITADGPVKLALDGVVGTGNAGVGVLADNGAQVLADAATTVIGSTDAYQVGATVVPAWVPANTTDAATFSRVNRA